MATPCEISGLLRARGEEFGLVPDGDTQVVRLGAGESYSAWRVAGWRTRDGDEVVFRIVRRPVSELPRPMVAEFEYLKLVPSDLGSQGVHLEESPADLGAPYMIVTLVPGALVPAGEWTAPLVAAHARQLARLHSLPMPTATRQPVSFSGFCADSRSWWQGAHPQIAASAASTLDALDRAAAGFEAAFAGVVGDRLIHGDGIVSNILVAGGVPRYVDWEWAEYGDPARDLGLLGGAIAMDPWYVPLSPAGLRAFVQAYADAAGRDDVDILVTRQQAWELADRAFFALHLRLLGTRGETRHADTATAVLAMVDEELARHGYH